jgi:serine-type D-Ala-D-Ala carboxypeptidase (penicillin-binding protein 5/6)
MSPCWRSAAPLTLDACPKSRRNSSTASPNGRISRLLAQDRARANRIPIAAPPGSVPALRPGSPDIQHSRSRALRWSPLRALAVGLLALLLAARITTEEAPATVIERTLATYARVPGPAPKLAWPRAGEAAVEVESLGAMGSSGGGKPVPIASVAKVMTAYLTLLEHPLAAGARGFVMTISPADVSEEERRLALGESTVAVRSGERLTERQALDALLIPSANNTAALLAVHDAGSVAAFVAQMNSTAKKLGMRSTTYTDPSGFNDGTRSTASDQLTLARFAMREQAFAGIVDQPAVELPVVGRVRNFNGLVGQEGYVGVKTGSDRAAGGCLVFAKRVVVAGRRLTILGVVLGQRGESLIEAALSSARLLGASSASALHVATIVPGGSNVLRVSSADGRFVNAVSAEALQTVAWNGLAIPLRLIVAPLVKRPRAGEQIATLGAGAASSATVVVRSMRTLAGPSLGWRLEHVFG